MKRSSFLAAAVITALLLFPVSGASASARPSPAPPRACSENPSQERCAPNVIADPGAKHASESGPPLTTQRRAPLASAAGIPDAFTLASRPSASKTIYLDFDGDYVDGRGDYWSDRLGTFIDSAPWSLDRDFGFSDAETSSVQRIYLQVAEDFAPFDINVTTKDPGSAGLVRSSVSDRAYGVRIVITDSNDVARYGCDSGCGGLATVGTYGATRQASTYYQRAWVFSSRLGNNIKNIAEEVSHEAGHTLGLTHDGQQTGTGTEEYYTGANGWGPLMGFPGTTALSQWSRGEYGGATTQQDDISEIASRLGLVADDHGNEPGTASVLTTASLGNGLISTSADRDYFAFYASGQTTVAVENAPYIPNLDVAVSIIDGSGTQVAAADPPSSKRTSTEMSGLDAEVSFEAPQSGETFYAVVDGVGSGDSASGGYSDYGSLGRYSIRLTTGSVATPPLTATALPDGNIARLKTPFSARAVGADGGTGVYFIQQASTLPLGLRFDAATRTVIGTPLQRGFYNPAFRVIDSAGQTIEITAALPVKNRIVGPTEASDAVIRVSAGMSARGALRASGGDREYAWSLVAGDLPPGISLGDAGRLMGAYEMPGTWTARVRVSSAGSAAEASVTFIVKAS